MSKIDITIQDIITFLTSANIETVKTIREACHTRVRRDAEIRNLIGINEFAPGQRVMLTGNIQKKYQGRIGTVTDIKQKRIAVNIDARLWEDGIMNLACLPEHLLILTDEESIKNPQIENKNGSAPMQPFPVGTTSRMFQVGERVKIRQTCDSRKWAGLEGVVSKIGPKNVSVETTSGGVRVSPELLEKIVA